MRCLSPRKVAFLGDGKTISFSPKKYSPEYVPFYLPCGKCIECRLEYARQWAIRCVHEAQMYENNSFLTLTYSDDNLPDKLVYSHFQNFIKKLREDIVTEIAGRDYWFSLSDSEKSRFREEHKDVLEKKRIGYFVTGEYGELKKRPHWHAIIFNWRPDDCVYKYSNDRGDKVFHSDKLQKLWGNGIAEVGSVTMESAGYCARYAAKKLVHGNDGQHDFDPVSKKSSRHAIGKKWLEKYYMDVFGYGYVILPDGQKASIPRYYEKWLQKHKPSEWEDYIINKKSVACSLASAREAEYQKKQAENSDKRVAKGNFLPQVTRYEARKTIIEQKFKNLQKYLKGDI